MRLVFLGFALTVILLVSGAQAYRLTDGLYFTVLPNSSAEVYFILPDDVGTGPGKADYFITTETNWSVDLTEQLVTTEENNTVIIPVNFYSSGRKEGECSNYTIRISAPEINVSKAWRGGACLSNYMDVDVSETGGNAKDVLNENVDLFSIGFGTYTKSSRPGEQVQIEAFVQSQANLTIDINLESEAALSQRGFVAETGPGSQYKGLVFNASAGYPGNYEVRATAKARDCPLASCTKQASMNLLVSDSGPQEGFSVSLFPENLNVKNLEPVPYRITIQNNYREEKLFIVRVDKPPDLGTSLILDTFSIPGLSERAINFTATPLNQTGFYEIKVVVRVDEVERIASAYLSANEMVSDAYRNAEDARAAANSSVKAEVDKEVRDWYSSYSKSPYGSNLNEYKSLQEAIDSARNASQSGQAIPGQNVSLPEEQEEPKANPLWIFAVPLVIGGVVLVVLLLFRKKQQNEEGEYLESA